MTDGDLKQKTATSIVWSTIDRFGFQVIALGVAIVTARLLSVDDFGLIGALAIFTQLSNVLVESGFSAALIRRKHNTDAEYSAALFFNIALSGLFYMALYFSAPAIARYFNMPELCQLARFLFLAIVCNSFGIVPNIRLTRALAFKQIMIADLSAAIGSGVVAIMMAVGGYGYWAIAWQQLLQAAIRTLLLIVFARWRPVLRASFHVISEIFSFSFVLIINSVISTTVRYIYNIFIGRYYTKTDLGYYAQAFKLQNIPSQIVSMALSGVAYPVISSLNNNAERQLLYFRKLMRINAFFIFPVMLGLVGIAENVIVVFLTDKWLPAVPYFRIMVAAAIFAPFQAFCLGTLNALGKPRWNFVLELLRNGLVILTLVLFHTTIAQMLLGFVAAHFVAYIADLVAVGRIMRYSLLDHLRDIAPYALLAGMMLGLVWICGWLLHNIYIALLVQIVVGLGFYLGLATLLGSQIMKDAFNMLKNKKITIG